MSIFRDSSNSMAKEPLCFLPLEYALIISLNFFCNPKFGRSRNSFLLLALPFERNGEFGLEKWIDPRCVTNSVPTLVRLRTSMFCSLPVLLNASASAMDTSALAIDAVCAFRYGTISCDDAFNVGCLVFL